MNTHNSKPRLQKRNYFYLFVMMVTAAAPIPASASVAKSLLSDPGAESYE